MAAANPILSRPCAGSWARIPIKTCAPSGMDDVIFSGGGSRPARNFAEVGARPRQCRPSRPGRLQRRRLHRNHAPHRAGAGLDLSGQWQRGPRPRRAIAVCRRRHRRALALARAPGANRRDHLGEAAGPPAYPRRRRRRRWAAFAPPRGRIAPQRRLREFDPPRRRAQAGRESVRQSQAGRRARRSRYRELAARIRAERGARRARVLPDRRRSIARGRRRGSRPTSPMFRRARWRRRRPPKAQAIAAHELPRLREREAEAGAAVHRLVAARQALEADEARATQRIGELDAPDRTIHARPRARGRADRGRERRWRERLEEERAELMGADSQDAEREEEARLRLSPRSKPMLAETESALGDAQEQFAGVNARRAALESALRDETSRVARFEAELTRLDTEFALIAGQGGGRGRGGAPRRGLRTRQPQRPRPPTRRPSAAERRRSARRARRRPPSRRPRRAGGAAGAAARDGGAHPRKPVAVECRRPAGRRSSNAMTGREGL